MNFKEVFEKILPQKKEEAEFLELEEKPEEKQINVRIEKLSGFLDSEKIQEFLREGNIVFLRIKELREKDISELQRAVNKLRKTCAAMDGDIVGVSEDYLILTPSFARVYRGK
jgi:SepF-like predicted cell division protein (DUF552 family)